MWTKDGLRVHLLLPKRNILLHGPAGFDSQIVPSHHSSKGTELLLYRDTHRHYLSPNTSENALAGLLERSVTSFLQQITLMTSAVAEIQTLFHSTQFTIVTSLKVPCTNPTAETWHLAKTYPFHPSCTWKVTCNPEPSTSYWRHSKRKSVSVERNLKSCDVPGYRCDLVFHTK